MSRRQLDNIVIRVARAVCCPDGCIMTHNPAACSVVVNPNYFDKARAAIKEVRRSDGQEPRPTQEKK